MSLRTDQSGFDIGGGSMALTARCDGMYTIHPMKIIIFITSTLVLVGILVAGGMLLPRFYFNELELEFRKEFQVAYSALDRVDEDIEMRKKEVEEVGDEEFYQIGRRIEADLDLAVKSLANSQLPTQKQQQMAWLLPSQYQEYLRLKQKSVQDYYDLTENFRQRKYNEHMLTETFLVIYNLDKNLDNYEDYEKWLNTLEQTPADADLIKSSAIKLLEAGHITQAYADFMIGAATGFMYQHDYFMKISESEENQEIDKDLLIKYFPPHEVVNAIFEENKEIWQERNQAHFEKMEVNYEEMDLTNRYYHENQVGLDPLSFSLAKFSDAFPRVKPQNTYQPLILPADTQIWRVS